MNWWIILAVLVGLFLFFFKFTMVSEGTAKVLIRLKGFRKIVLALKGHKPDNNSNVVPGQTFHLPGGLRFVGFRFIDGVFKYKFRWRDIRFAGQEEKVDFNEKVIDYILVKDQISWTDIKNAETMAPERIPVNLEFLITMRVVNPYKALFRAPMNWNENVIGRLNTLLRGWVSAEKTLDSLLELKKDPKKIWQELGNKPLIMFFKDEWGIEIIENGIDLKDVGLNPDYQKAAALEKQMLFEAGGAVNETIGQVVAMMAKSRNKSIEDIQSEINGNEELKKEFLRLSEDLVIRRMGIKGGAYVDIRVEGAQGLEKMILNLLAAKQMLQRTVEEPPEEGGAKEGGAEDPVATPPKKQAFWAEKRPMERFHKKRRKK